MAIGSTREQGATATIFLFESNHAMPKHPKRPRDLNQWAKHIVDVASGESDDHEVAGQPKNAQAASAGRLGGRIGGKAQAKAMSPKQRSLSAKRAAQARWTRKD